MATKYTAIYDLGDDGWWTVRIKDVPGVHSQGRSIAQARNRVREALSLFVDGAATAEFQDSIRVAPEIRRALDLTLAAKRQVVKDQARLAKLSIEAAKKLVNRMSVRDAGEVLGLSHQRVQQLARSKAKRATQSENDASH
jgi:predicted RNase H-like HicB family nuclease